MKEFSLVLFFSPTICLFICLSTCLSFSLSICLCFSCLYNHLCILQTKLVSEPLCLKKILLYSLLFFSTCFLFLKEKVPRADSQANPHSHFRSAAKLLNNRLPSLLVRIPSRQGRQVREGRTFLRHCHMACS